MKFKLEKKQISDILKLSNTIISDESLNPILSSILIKTDNINNNIYFIYASQSRMVKQTITNVEINEDFIVCIKNKIFNGIVSKLSNSEITFEKIDNVLRIKTDNFESNINIIDYLLYPEFDFNEYKSFSNNTILNVNLIHDIYKKTFGTTAINTTTLSTLAGINFDGTDLNTTSFISTDSFRVSLFQIPNTNNNNFNFIIDPEELKIIIDNSKLDEQIEIFYKEQTIFFKWSNTIFKTKLLIGSYPNIYPHFLNKPKSEIKINAKDLLNMLERGSSLVQNEKTPNAKVLVNFEKIEISYNSLDFGSSYETIKPQEFTGEEFSFQINIKFFISMLKIYDQKDEIILGFYQPNNPITIQKSNDDSLRQLILPLRA